jgi:hypothetical protein
MFYSTIRIGLLAIVAPAALLSAAGAQAATPTRASSAFNAFRPGYGAVNQACVTENWGATNNTCATLQSEDFETVIDGPGQKNVEAVVLANGGSVGCFAGALASAGPIANRIIGASVTSPASGYATLNFDVGVPANYNMRVVCYVPPGSEVLSLTWNK